MTLGESVDVGRERYGMNWPGKAECFKTIQAPSMGTLLPCPDESVNFDTTENMIIEGDNLEVLKLLQKSYLGKVKMIYIVIQSCLRGVFWVFHEWGKRDFRVLFSQLVF